MDNVFFIGALVSLIFFIFKMLEMKYIEKEAKPFKLLARDTLIVYTSTVIGMYTIDQLTPIVKESNISGASDIPLAFTDNPPF